MGALSDAVRNTSSYQQLADQAQQETDRKDEVLELTLALVAFVADNGTSPRQAIEFLEIIQQLASLLQPNGHGTPLNDVDKARLARILSDRGINLGSASPAPAQTINNATTQREPDSFGLDRAAAGNPSIRPETIANLTGLIGRLDRAHHVTLVADGTRLRIVPTDGNGNARPPKDRDVPPQVNAATRNAGPAATPPTRRGQMDTGTGEHRRDDNSPTYGGQAPATPPQVNPAFAVPQVSPAATAPSYPNWTPPPATSRPAQTHGAPARVVQDIPVSPAPESRTWGNAPLPGRAGLGQTGQSRLYPQSSAPTYPTPTSDAGYGADDAADDDDFRNI